MAQVELVFGAGVILGPIPAPGIMALKHVGGTFGGAGVEGKDTPAPKRAGTCATRGRETRREEREDGRECGDGQDRGMGTRKGTEKGWKRQGRELKRDGRGRDGQDRDGRGRDGRETRNGNYDYICGYVVCGYSYSLQ